MTHEDPSQPDRTPGAHERTPSASGTGSGPESIEALVPNQPGASGRIAGELVTIAERLGYGKASRFAIRLAFEEAMNNAFKHGHRDLPADATVRVAIELTAQHVRIIVEDRGPGFDPAAIPDPTTDENLAKPSGRGLMLMNAYMSDVRHSDDGRRLEMVYSKPAGEPSDTASGSA